MVIFAPMKQPLYSLRMHSSHEGHHLSGAESLVDAAALDAATVGLIRRALQHPRGTADRINLTVELVNRQSLALATLPALRTLTVAAVAEGRELARKLLMQSGVAPLAAKHAMQALIHGAAPGGASMRGAMLVDGLSGQRLEADRSRGVRVSHLGLDPGLEQQLGRRLEALGLNNPHVREALVLAGKVSMHPAILAELCWSDDPDYTAGYVCSRAFGYLRIPLLKPAGETRGGRAFFLRPGSDLVELTSWLETGPVLFERLGELHQAIKGGDYVALMDA
jgi:6-carboxyhexanoate--CoA ligase